MLDSVDKQKHSDEKQLVKSESSKQKEKSNDKNPIAKIEPESKTSLENIQNIENQAFEKQSNATDEKSASSTPNSK